IAPAHPLHRRLILGPPRIGELIGIERGHILAQSGGHLGGRIRSPIDDGAEHVEDEGLNRAESCHHDFTVPRPPARRLSRARSIWSWLWSTSASEARHRLDRVRSEPGSGGGT